MNLLVELVVNYFLPTNCTDWHESFKWINGDRVGRTNCHECNEGFIYMSCGVVPSRHISLACLSEDFVPGYYRYALYCLPGSYYLHYKKI